MKHASCHLQDGAICTLCHSGLLRYKHSEGLQLDVMNLQKVVEYLGGKPPLLRNQSALILTSDCISTSVLNYSKHFHLNFNECIPSLRIRL